MNILICLCKRIRYCYAISTDFEVRTSASADLKYTGLLDILLTYDLPPVLDMAVLVLLSYIPSNVLFPLVIILCLIS